MDVAKNIRQIRKAKGVTMTFLARGLGMSLQGYRYIENGKTRLDVSRALTIARLLNVDISVFFDDKLTESVISEMAV